MTTTQKPAPGGNRAAGDGSSLNNTEYSLKISRNQASEIARALGGDHFGANISCPGPGHGPRDRSLSIQLDPQAPDGFRVHSFAGDDWRACRDYVKAALGLQACWTYAPPIQKPAARNCDQYTDISRTDYAKKTWSESRPIHRTGGEIYLRGRAITCALPGTLRFAPACRHTNGQRFPALVALVQGADDLAVHRTYLRPDGSDKADVIPDKAMLGSTQGGAVRLTEYGTATLVVAEGIETALSLASGLISEPAAIWAALSTSGLRGLRLPTQPGRLIIASDGDRPGRAAAHTLAARAQGLGWTVSLLPAPDGRDWNDVLAMKGRPV